MCLASIKEGYYILNGDTMHKFFKRIQSKTHLFNPLKDLSFDEIPFEIRYDPLTGETGRVFDTPYRPPERPEIDETVQRSKELFCPFCPDALETSTPLFPEELIPGGRIRQGKATLIPNLLPFDTYAGVAILSEEHYIKIADLTPEIMKDAFSASLLFIQRVVEFDPEVHFFSINWNYMPQSGSSLVHPHIQVNCGYIPTNHHRIQIEGCKRYLKENGTSFWQDFIHAEKECKERFIAEIGPTFWALSFVPQSFLPDVWCIFPDYFSPLQVSMAEMISFLQGLASVLHYFSKENIPAFNMSIFSVRDDDAFRMNVRIIPRLLTRAIGNSDRAYLYTLHKEPYTVIPPEPLCLKLKESFT
jgi:UDPglucose--hexose-1-phosphate uridylyltransferase